MAFIILGDSEHEWERRPLRQAITIGRSFDCELPVRDSQLSRKHCRLEQHGNQWVLIDLKSRNGTRIGDNAIKRHVLEDGDVIRLGQTRICFRSGGFVPAKAPSFLPARARPIDPVEAMATTMTGADFAQLDSAVSSPRFPIPQPKPSEPKAFERDGVATLLNNMASGVWDSRLSNQALAIKPAHAVPWPAEAPRSAPNGVAKKSWRFERPTPHDADRPERKLIMAYLFLAGGVFAASLCAIVWPM